MNQIEIREAKAEDSALILRFIKHLASYEKSEDQVTATVDSIRESIFSSDSTTHAIICTINKVPVGFAVYFYNYSTASFSIRLFSTR